MADIFISYATPDREQARKLATALEQCGWSVWWDRHIKVGQSFDDVIERALDASKSVIVLWSKHSISSEWVKNEAASAAKRGVLIPVLIEEIEPPLEFRRKQNANLSGWKGDLSFPGLQALREGISAIVASSPGPNQKIVFDKPPTGPRSNRVRVVTAAVILTAVIVCAAYLAWHARMAKPQEDSILGGDPKAASTGAGTLNFKWPGATDCWQILRGQDLVTSHYGSAEQTLQPGTYTAKSCTDPVFLPFSITVKPNATTTTDAMAGTLNFKWPGATDCWQIFRGAVSVTSHYGSAAQALQAGTYTVRPCTGAPFLPFSITIKPNATVTTDATAGTLDFKWPGTDCWQIFRGEDLVTNHYGSAVQALQAGSYTVSPCSPNLFQPRRVQITRGRATTAP